MRKLTLSRMAAVVAGAILLIAFAIPAAGSQRH
jgi:hypothetical protein